MYTVLFYFSCFLCLLSLSFCICLHSFQVRGLGIACTPGFSFAVFMSKPTVVRDWNIQGLPTDAFSTENGIIVTRGNRSVHHSVSYYKFY